MSLMLTEIYDALKDAGASEEKSRNAAVAVAAYDARFGEVKADLAAFRSEMKAELAAFRGEVKADMAAFRGEMKTELAAFRGEMRADRATLRGEMLLMRWILAFLLGGVLMLLAPTIRAWLS